MDSGALLPQGDPSITSKSGGRGGWPAALFLIAVEFVERVGFYGVHGNLIMYLTGPLGLTTAAAAAGVNAWGGTASMLPLLGALAADSCIGRYRAVVAAGVLYILSYGMLTVSSMVPPPHAQPPACEDASAACSQPASPARTAIFFGTIYVVALAQGFHKPNAQAIGADQFPPSAPGGVASRSSFFNWLHFSMSWGYIVAVVALSYVQDNVGWAAGFGASWAMMIVSLSVFLLGTRTYRAERPRDRGALARLTKTFAAMARAWTHRILRRMDAMDNESSQTPEEQKGKGVVVKLLPIWMTSVVYGMVIAQVSTFFTKQGSTMDRRIGIAGIVVPPAALQSFTGLAIIASVPVYDRVFVPLARRFTKQPSGITMLQRIGTGMAIATVAIAVAALMEAARLRAARDAGLIDLPRVAVPMSLWWMVPQYVLMGLADVFTVIGLEEFFYDQVPEALRSVGLALCLSAMGVGSYASGVVVSAIDWVTRSTGDSWFVDNLNRAHLDYFYWVLAGVAALEVLVFLYLAKGYVYTNRCEFVDTMTGAPDTNASVNISI